MRSVEANVKWLRGGGSGVDGGRSGRARAERSRVKPDRVGAIKRRSMTGRRVGKYCTFTSR